MRRCILLAAGLGTRLRPLTLHTPKCLLPVAGRPMLQWWLDHLERYAYDEVLINTHHLADQVERFVDGYAGPLRVGLVHEATLLGSAGTLRRNRSFFSDACPVLVANADNLTDADLAALRAGHERFGRHLSMALFRPPDLSRTGVVELGGDSCIVGFEEKPARPRGQWANAGLYLMDGQVVDALQAPDPADVARDLMPLWLGRATGLPLDGYLRDVGTPEAYAAAQREWRA